jgi:DNA-binding MarR family transcriptional regulator
MGKREKSTNSNIMKDKEDPFKLENQLCFPLYAASRLVTNCYQPVLNEMGITYPQYLVLIVLWENDAVNLNFLAEKLKLQSNTLTPLLKRMQEMDLIDRKRSTEDERSVVMTLTKKGKALKTEAPKLHKQLSGEILGISVEEGIQLRALLMKLINSIDG